MLINDVNQSMLRTSFLAPRCRGESAILRATRLDLPWCTYKLLYFDVPLLWKLLWAQNRITQFFLPSPTVRLHLILISNLADLKWKQYLPLLPPPASK